VFARIDHQEKGLVQRFHGTASFITPPRKRARLNICIDRIKTQAANVVKKTRKRDSKLSLFRVHSGFCLCLQRLLQCSAGIEFEQKPVKTK